MRQLKISTKITNRESQAVEKYLQEISKFPLLTAEEEVKFWYIARTNPEWSAARDQAIDKLVKANLRFVVSVAKQYEKQWLPLSDLINEGNIGLAKAAQRYDETRWFKFISYAVWRIRQGILQALAEQGRIVKLPANKIWGVNKLMRAVNKFVMENEREPDEEELKELLDMDSIEDVKQLRTLIEGRHDSLDAPLNDELDSGTRADFLVAETKEVLIWGFSGRSVEEVQEAIREVFQASNLSEREKYVLEHFFWINEKEKLDLEVIWEKYGLTRERVRQVKEKAIRKLSSKVHNQGSVISKIFRGEVTVDPSLLTYNPPAPVRFQKVEKPVAKKASLEKAPENMSTSFRRTREELSMISDQRKAEKTLEKNIHTPAAISTNNTMNNQTGYSRRCNPHKLPGKSLIETLMEEHKANPTLQPQTLDIVEKDKIKISITRMKLNKTDYEKLLLSMDISENQKILVKIFLDTFMKKESIVFDFDPLFTESVKMSGMLVGKNEMWIYLRDFINKIF